MCWVCITKPCAASRTASPCPFFSGVAHCTSSTHGFALFLIPSNPLLAKVKPHSLPTLLHRLTIFICVRSRLFHQPPPSRLFHCFRLLHYYTAPCSTHCFPDYSSDNYFYNPRGSLCIALLRICCCHGTKGYIPGIAELSLT